MMTQAVSLVFKQPGNEARIRATMALLYSSFCSMMFLYNYIHCRSVNAYTIDRIMSHRSYIEHWS